MLKEFLDGTVEQQDQIFEDYVYLDQVGGVVSPFSDVQTFVKNR